MNFNLLMIRVWKQALLPIGLVLSAAALRSVFVPVLRYAPYITFFPAITISALYGGWWSGLLAIVLSGIVISNVFSSGVSALFNIPGSLAGMLVFLGSSIVIAGVCSQLRTAQQRITAEAHRLRESEGALEAEVAERKRIEEALRQSQKERERYLAQLEAILNNLTEGLVVSDLEGNLLYWNPAAVAMHGFASPEEGRRRLPELVDTFELSTEEEGTLPLAQWPLARVLRGETLHAWEVHIRRHGSRNGWQRVFNYGGTLARDKGGRPLLAVITVQDITERKLAEEERERLLADVRRSNRELEQFAYVASHDLQEPLRMVASYVQLLEKKYKGALDERADTYINFAVDGAMRMQKLIEGLLAYSRITRRGGEFGLVDANKVFAEVISNLSAALSESRAVVTKDDLPGISGDETQLVQLLQNLVANAVKFRKPGIPPLVHVSAQRKGREWVFSVRDNGIGISPEYYDRIFLIFQRLHTREEYPGTGIGLALCKRIVERHHGRIWVESAPGEGATFFFTIPAGGRNE